MTKSTVEVLSEAVVDLTEKIVIRVLHVDDELGFLKVAQQCLETQGAFQVETALSVEEALKKMKKQTFDVIVSDYMMPGKDGLEFLKELKDSGDKVPFIMFTGRGREEVAVKALNLGADQYINKIGDPETVYGELAHGICQVVESKRAEEGLKGSENYLKTILDSIFTGVVVIDEETHKIVDANSNALETIGASREHVVGKVCHNFVCPAEEGRCPISDLGQTVDKSERLLLRADGERIPILKTVTTTIWRGHKYMIESFIDITERKKAEKGLQKSEERFKALMEEAPIGICNTDLKGKITYINKRFEEATGYSSEEIVGKNGFKLGIMSEETLKSFKKRMKERLMGKTSRLLEGRFKRKDGEWIWAETEGRVIRRFGVPVGFQLAARDITKRKQAEQELKESEERFRNLYESIQDPVGIFVGREGLLIDYNKAFKKLCGYTDEELKNKIFLEFIHPDDQALVLEKYRTEYSEEELPLVYEIRGVNKKGEAIPLEISVSTYKKGGRIIGILVIHRDITERKNAEERVRASEEKYRSLFENAGDVTLTLDLKGKITSINKAAEEYGFKKDDVIGRNMLKFASRKHWPRLLKELAQLAQGKRVEGNIEIITPKGKKTAEYNSNPIIINSRVVGVRAILKDVTERKKAEEKISQQNEFLNNALESLTHPFYVIDANDYTVKIANSAAGFGVLSEKSTCYGLTHKRKKPCSAEHPCPLREVKKTKKPAVAEHVHFDKDGNPRNIEVHGYPIFDNDGNVVQMIEYFLDITERKKVEERLRESEERLRNLYENIPDSLAVFVGREGHLLECNKAFKKRTGYTDEELKDKKFLDFVHPEDRAMIREKYRTRYPEEELPIVFEMREINKKGEALPTEVSVSTYKKKGKVIGIEVMQRDITERKQAEKALTDTMKKLVTTNEKLGVVGSLTRHDVRNKLTAARANIFLAEKKLGRNNDALKHLWEINAAIGLTERIFDFARTYEKLGVEELAPMNVEKSIAEAVSLFSDLKGVKVVNDCRGLTVSADSLLSPMFYNLIHNSLKHGEKVSQIRVYYEEAGKDGLKLVYEDDGIGIPKSEKEKIFEEGFGKGTGYGLYLTRKMCEVYGWTIKETGKHGKGAQFVIIIPKMNESGKIVSRLHWLSDHRSQN